MELTHEQFRLSVLGAGGFSHFSIDAFLEVHGVSITGVSDANFENAQSFADKFKCKMFKSQAELFADPETDIIYIATPPFLHYQNSKDSLLAGKHVICEKPAAFHANEVEELIEIAKTNNLLYVVNLMQRYNPLFGLVKILVDEELLGSFLHGYFENYASDETLNEAHWMWDESKSGGVFIEHAVHFFDLIEGWLGKGEMIASQKISRKGKTKSFYPEVQSVCTYQNCLFNFYHGFHQANRMDRQELKLVFESGDLTLYEWVPSMMVIKALVTSEILEALTKLFADGEVEVVETFSGDEKIFRSHSAQRKADHRITLKFGDPELKYTIYRQLLTSMIKDQLRWVKDRKHLRKITDENALRSVAMAEQADKEAVII